MAGNRIDLTAVTYFSNTLAILYKCMEEGL